MLHISVERKWANGACAKWAPWGPETTETISRPRRQCDGVRPTRSSPDQIPLRFRSPVRSLFCSLASSSSEVGFRKLPRVSRTPSYASQARTRAQVDTAWGYEGGILRPFGWTTLTTLVAGGGTQHGNKTYQGGSGSETNNEYKTIDYENFGNYVMKLCHNWMSAGGRAVGITRWRCVRPRRGWQPHWMTTSPPATRGR